MYKHTLKVPKGVNHLSDWKSFRLFRFPYIIDKQLTGCGFTQWALSCNQDIILCSPRRILLENKVDWYNDLQEKVTKGVIPPLNFEIYYAINEYEKVLGIDKDMSSSKREIQPKIVDENLAKDHSIKYKELVQEFFYNCKDHGKQCKILVTYDSFRKVQEALEEIGVFKQFYTVIDEWQSIFIDSHFKSDTEMEFIRRLQGDEKICYVSATPMIDSYLEQLDEFKDLPYLSLDWSALDKTRVTQPSIDHTPCSKITAKILEIIEKYRMGSWKDSDNNTIRRVNEEGKVEEISSKEAVFYLNSVKGICEVIKKGKIKLSECNVLCADTKANRDLIKKAFGVKKLEKDDICRVPRENEPNKMFTFCTRTVYLGADFYSDNARSFVFSDANIDSLSVDITLDLPQILGRQRDDRNPWKNSLVIYYKTLDTALKETEADFKRRIDMKKKATNDLIRVFNSAPVDTLHTLIDTYEETILASNYRKNYLSIDRHDGRSPKLIMNKLVLLSDIREYEVRQVSFADRCVVRSNIQEQFGIIKDPEADKILDEYEKRVYFRDKMRYLCDSLKTVSDNTFRRVLKSIDDYMANYINILGIDKIVSLSCQRSTLDIEVKKIINNQDIDISDIIYSEFNVGDRITKAEIKDRLKKIYALNNYKKVAKATDLSGYFDVKQIKITRGGKESHGLELLKKKGILGDPKTL